MAAPVSRHYMTVHCRACRHQWTLPMKMPIPIERFEKALKGFVAAGCPECGHGGQNVMCGPTPPKSEAHP